MTRWNSLKKGHRGDETEELINMTNDELRRKKIALISKIPVPIKVINREGCIINKAFFEEKSVVDYVGICQGYAVCFDAKETEKKSIPFSNVHEHQIEYMEEFRKQGGYSFLILNFKAFKELFLVPIEVVRACIERGKKGGRKSFAYKEMDRDFLITKDKNGFLNYLEALNRYIVKYEKPKE